MPALLVFMPLYLLRHELSAADFIDASIPRDIYGSLGWSVMYCAEIESAWKLS